MLNKVMIIGRLGRDPELRYTQSGSPICNLNIATDESYTDRDGNKVDRAVWWFFSAPPRIAPNTWGREALSMSRAICKPENGRISRGRIATLRKFVLSACSFWIGGERPTAESRADMPAPSALLPGSRGAARNPSGNSRVRMTMKIWDRPSLPKRAAWMTCRFRAFSQ